MKVKYLYIILLRNKGQHENFNIDFPIPTIKCGVFRHPRTSIRLKKDLMFRSAGLENVQKITNIKGLIWTYRDLRPCKFRFALKLKS
jgi:hypothetical protein